MTTPNLDEIERLRQVVRVDLGKYGTWKYIRESDYDKALDVALQLVERVRVLEDILHGLVCAKDSVTMGQEKELFAAFMPKARAALRKEPDERA